MVGNSVKCDDHEVLIMATNGRQKVFPHKANLNLLPISVHFNQDSIATILAFKDAVDLPWVHNSMDAGQGRAFVVKLSDGKVLKFKRSASGLFYYETDININDNVIVYSTV